MRTIIENIRTAQKQQKISREVLAYKSGIHINSLCKMMKNPSLSKLETIQKVSNALGIPLHELLTPKNLPAQD